MNVDYTHEYIRTACTARKLAQAWLCERVEVAFTLRTERVFRYDSTALFLA